MYQFTNQDTTQLFSLIQDPNGDHSGFEALSTNRADFAQTLLGMAQDLSCRQALLPEIQAFFFRKYSNQNLDMNCPVEFQADELLAQVSTTQHRLNHYYITLQNTVQKKETEESKEVKVLLMKQDEFLREYGGTYEPQCQKLAEYRAAVDKATHQLQEFLVDTSIYCHYVDLFKVGLQIGQASAILYARAKNIHLSIFTAENDRITLLHEINANSPTKQYVLFKDGYLYKFTPIASKPVENAGVFSQFPENVILIIANLLRVTDLISFSYTCKFIHNLLVAKVRSDFYSPAYIEHQLKKINYENRIKCPLFYPKNETFLKEQKWQHQVCLELDTLISKIDTFGPEELNQFLAGTQIPVFFEKIRICNQILEKNKNPQKGQDPLKIWEELKLKQKSSKAGVTFTWKALNKKFQGGSHRNKIMISLQDQELVARYYRENGTYQFEEKKFNLQTIKKSFSLDIQSFNELVRRNKKTEKSFLIIEKFLLDFFLQPDIDTTLDENYKENVENINYMRVIDILAYYLYQYPEKMKKLLSHAALSPFADLLSTNTISKLLILSSKNILTYSAYKNECWIAQLQKVALLINLNHTSSSTFLQSNNWTAFQQQIEPSIQSVLSTVLSDTHRIDLITAALVATPFPKQYWLALIWLSSSMSLLKKSIKQQILTALQKHASIAILRKAYKLTPLNDPKLWDVNNFEKFVNVFALNYILKTVENTEKNGSSTEPSQSCMFIPQTYGGLMNGNTLLIDGGQHKLVNFEHHLCEKYNDIDLVPICNVAELLDAKEVQSILQAQISQQLSKNSKRKLETPEDELQPPAKKLKVSENNSEKPSENSTQPYSQAALVSQFRIQGSQQTTTTADMQNNEIDSSMQME